MMSEWIPSTGWQSLAPPLGSRPDLRQSRGGHPTTGLLPFRESSARRQVVRRACRGHGLRPWGSTRLMGAGAALFSFFMLARPHEARAETERQLMSPVHVASRNVSYDHAETDGQEIERTGDLPVPVEIGSGVPLPPGTPLPADTVEVWVGSRRLTVDSFATRMAEGPLIRFYRDTLPREGWRIEPLPWQARHVAITQHLEQLLAQHPQAPEAPEAKAQIERNRRAIPLLERQIYAARGPERVIIQLAPMGDRLEVFLNRWQEPGETGMSGASDPWLAQNALCSSDAVPRQHRLLEQLVPDYPAARIVAQSGDARNDDVTVLAMTRDAAETVAAHYTATLPSYGWRRVESSPVHEADTEHLLLRYEQARRVCLIVIRGVVPSRTGERTMVAVSIMKRPTLLNAR